MKKSRFFSLIALMLSFAGINAQKVDTPTLGEDYLFSFADGSIITSTDGSSAIDYGILKIYPGEKNAFKLNGADHGTEFKDGNYMELAVAGNVTLKFGGCQYTATTSTITVSTADGSYSDTRLSQTTGCFHNDATQTVDFVYQGAATTLKIAFAENKTYVPNLQVIAEKNGTSVTEAVKNTIYNFNLLDGSIVANDADGKSNVEMGLFNLAVGAKNAYGANTSGHGVVLKEGNQVTLKVAGNSRIQVGGCQFSNGTVSISSTTGQFNITSQNSKTATCYKNDGSYVEFIYVGTEGTVTLDFTGTNYVGGIRIVPVPYDYELAAWVKKSGVITINDVNITLTAGDSSSDNASVEVSSGTVILADKESASVRIPLGGKTLAESSISFTGDIADVTADGDILNITYKDDATKPSSYSIEVVANDLNTAVEAGKTYSYNFADGSELPQTSYTTLRYAEYTTKDGILTLKSNTDDAAAQFGYHDSSHGLSMYAGNSMTFPVAGNAVISFSVCQYGSANDAVFEITDAQNNSLGSVAAHNIGAGACTANNFSYAGGAATLTATLKSEAFAGAEIYIHGIAIENAAKIEESNGLIDAWDFGAQQLDQTIYRNNLTVDVINSWYSADITAGSAGNVLPNFTAGVLSYVGGGNDRLRTSNEALTRWDANGVNSFEGIDFTGGLYVNSSAATNRYLSISLSEDDEITIYAKGANNSNGLLNFEYVADPQAQTDQVETGAGTKVCFVAKQAGTYHIFDTKDKALYYRVLRKDATYVTVSGSIDVTAADGIPSGYSIVLTNEAGKSWSGAVTGNTYSAKVPAGYNYTLSLADAFGYVITDGKTLATTEETTTHNIAVSKVVMYALSGNLAGLGADLANITSLTFTADPSQEKVYIPEAVLDLTQGTYTVNLEPDCQYTITAEGINDYQFTPGSVTITEATTKDITFELKPRYNVTLTCTTLTAEQMATLKPTFTNLNEEGYSYTFDGVSAIVLRDGVYSISMLGLDELPLQLGLTSNVKVEGADVTKAITFNTVTEWPFNDRVIANGDASYKGLKFTGTVYNEIAKGHLVAKEGATVSIPVKASQKVTIQYYYAADFTIEGGENITCTSGSTSSYENTTYTTTGTEGDYLDLTMGAGTTYITNIKVGDVVAYRAKIEVGQEKEFKTINAALEAIRNMDRTSSQRVEVAIEPGNYEEMLVVDVDSVTFSNAALIPSIALKNQGVDIDENAVRITSYYGHGYNYYSMTNQKWDEETLRVNKENGYCSYTNTGSGSTNGSMWNATVVINAHGFVANNIIFENSFNQYISQKESEDVVEEWEVGGKGTRPTDMGNTNVQNKSFVERAAAVAIGNDYDKTIFNKCRIIGRQDSFFGGVNARVAVYKGSVMGACDYIFGGMVATFYQTELAMNTSSTNTDVAYITAAQQVEGRGYLMYECTVTSAQPGTETASAEVSKPGYFGRPWAGTTSEVVYYNTTVEKSNDGSSLITPAGWNASLGGAAKCYEFGTNEVSGEDNSASRVDWSTVLTSAVLPDNTEITCLNFTKGNDGWDPIKMLSDIDNSIATVKDNASALSIIANGNTVRISGAAAQAQVSVYSIDGTMISSQIVENNESLQLESGLWIVKAVCEGSIKAAKVVIR